MFSFIAFSSPAPGHAASTIERLESSGLKRVAFHQYAGPWVASRKASAHRFTDHPPHIVLRSNVDIRHALADRRQRAK